MMRLAFLTTLISVSASAAIAAGPRVDIVIGEKSPALEKRAALDIAFDLKKVYDAEVKIGTTAPEGADNVILVGRSETNDDIRALRERWPRLSDQGHVVRSIQFRGRPALVIGGRTSAAVYWAAAEYAHRLGIRSMLYGDLYPVAPQPFTLEGFDIAMEPLLQDRAWQTMGDLPIGLSSWGLEDQKLLLRQLARLKFNRLVIAVHPWQPFVHFEFEEIKKKTGVLWYGWQFPVSGDTAGRAAFKSAKFFENPDFAGKSTYQERLEAGQNLIRELIKEANGLGMRVALSFNPLEFPKEFGAVLPDAKPVRDPVELAIGPGPKQKPDDERLLKLADAQLHGYLHTYHVQRYSPSVESLYLSISDVPEWSSRAEASWTRLSEGALGIPGLNDVLAGEANRKTKSFDELIKAARNRSITASKDKSEQSLRGNIVALDFLRHLLRDDSTFYYKTAPPVHVAFAQVDPALYVDLPRIMPANTSALHFVGNSARRVAENRDLLAPVNPRAARTSLILTLGDCNSGILPQAAHSSLATLMGELQDRRWNGYLAQCCSVGGLDHTAYFVSRRSFGAGMTPETACHDLVTPVCGDGVESSVLKALGQIEAATTLIDQSDLRFGFPVPDLMMKHYASSDPPPEWWSKVRDNYLGAMNDMYRANSRAREGGRSYTLYLARRCEFGYEYMNCVEATRKAGIAKSKKDTAEQRAQLERAIESMNTACSALAAVARDQSDRGMIAVCNEFGYKVLQKELEKLDAE